MKEIKTWMNISSLKDLWKSACCPSVISHYKTNRTVKKGEADFLNLSKVMLCETEKYKQP